MVRKRPRIEPTDDWQQILPLCWWPEQVEYERIRQPVLFVSPVAGRAEETGVSESTLRRRIGRSLRTKGCRVCSPPRRPGGEGFHPTSADSSWTSR
jgi:hypothetical protein